MQTLNDALEAAKARKDELKDLAKSSASELESLRAQHAESQRLVQALQLEEDDNRLMPLYDWYLASLNMHHSIKGVLETQSVSMNEIRHVYAVGDPPVGEVGISLVFDVDTRRLAQVKTTGFEDLGVETEHVVLPFIQSNDAAGCVAVLLKLAREAALQAEG